MIFHRLHGKVDSGYSYTLHAWKSRDEGRTFSPLTEFAAKKDFALCNATVKRLTSGRLLLPVNPAAPGEHGPSGKYAVTVLYSDIETDPTRAFSNPGCRFTRDGKAIVNYWTCEYLPDWRMQDVIDLRVAIIDTAWFYEQ